MLALITRVALLFTLLLGTGAADAADSPLPSGAPAASLTKSDVDTWLDGFLPYAMRKSDIAGGVVVVVKDGAVLTERGFGLADVARKQAADPQTTLFRLGSVSKLFVWTAVMQLVEQGKLDLDKDVNAYLDFRIPARADGPITLRHLMTHTPGFEEQGKYVLLASAKGMPRYDQLLKTQIPRRIFKAGTTPAYSNYGATLAAYIVERAAKEPFETYVERHIFQPLGMRASTFRQPVPTALAGRLSKGYWRAATPPGAFEVVGAAPAGSASMTGADMARFMIAHLNGGAFNGRSILRPETVAQMQDTPLTLMPRLNRMELGFTEYDINGRDVVGHEGDTQFFHAGVYLFRKEKVGLYFVFNSLGAEVGVAGLRNALFTDFADRYFPALSPIRRASRIEPGHAAAMAGNWIDSRRSESNFLKFGQLFGQVSLTADPDGALVSPFPPGPSGLPLKWTEVEPYVWLADDGHTMLAAKLENGHPVRFAAGGTAPFKVFDRVPASENAAILVPLFFLSLALLALTAIAWPIRAIVRKRTGAPWLLDARQTRAYRLSRIAALAILLAMMLWIGLFLIMVSDATNLGPAFDAPLHVAQSFGCVAFIGGLLVLIWNLWVNFRHKAGWKARSWAILLVLSAFVVLWVAAVHQLLSFGVIY